MALAPLTRECPSPPFNTTPIWIDRQFSVPWRQYFTDLHDWMEASEGALRARAQAAEDRVTTLEARLTDIQTRLTAAGL